MLQSNGGYVHLPHASEQGCGKSFSTFVPGEQREISVKKGSENRVEGEKWEEASVYPFLWGNKNATRNSQHLHGGSTMGFLGKPSQGRSEGLCPGQCFVLCLQTNAFFFFFCHQIETCISGGFRVNVSVTRYHMLQENDLAGFLS